jgi:protein-S-isoprenylcysteine O-methyltransferase Ste14
MPVLPDLPLAGLMRRGFSRSSQLIRRAGRRTTSAERAVRVLVNLAGAVCAAWFARASVEYFVQTHRLIGALFCIEQAWFAVAFLLRRPASAVSRQPGNWLLAAGGTFGGLLFRPTGAHELWAVRAGFVLQLAGLILAIASLLALGRSFGFVAADRGVVTRGPYAAVRHPVYASYLLIQTGYVAQATSWRNLVVLVVATACNIGRILAEERILSGSPAYHGYRQRVRFRLLPGLW